MTGTIAPVTIPFDVVAVEESVESVDGRGGGGRDGRPRSRVIRVILTLATLYVGACVLMAVAQDRLIFFPSQVYAEHPGDHGMPYEDIELITEDGLHLHSWYLPAPGDPRGTVIITHGNGGNISHRLGVARFWLRRDLNVLLLGYRGYGRNPGSPSEAGFQLDADAAWRWLTETRGEPPQRIICFGRSLGGGTASYLAHRYQPAGLVLESTFTSVRDVARERFPIFPVGLLLRHPFDTLSRMPGIRCPVLVAHSPRDEIVGFQHGQRLYAAAKEPRSWIELGSHHNDLSHFRHHPGYQAVVDQFLDAALDAMPPRPAYSSKGDSAASTLSIRLHASTASSGVAATPGYRKATENLSSTSTSSSRPSGTAASSTRARSSR
jgi:uncharacterized protein